MSELPKSWTAAIMGDAIRSVRNGRNIKQDKSGNGTPVSRIETIAQEEINFDRVGYTKDDVDTERDLLTQGDLLFSHINSATHLGKTAVYRSERPLFHGINLLRIEVERQFVDPEFFHQQCRFMRQNGVFELNGQHAVNQSSINQKKLKELPFVIPPLPEQRRIVRQLDALSARNTTARTHLRAIAKLVERMRGAVLSKALNGTLLPQQEAAAEPTELGEFILGIEQGWSPKCENEAELNPEEWAVLTTTAIQAITFDSSENKKLPPHLEPRPNLEVKVGDVLMTRAGPRVRCAVCCFVAETSPRRIFSDKIYRIELETQADPEFFVMMMNAPEMVRALDAIKSGGNESGLNLTQGRLKSLAINLWDIEVQRDVVTEVKRQFEGIERLAAEAEKALKLTDRLDERILAKAFAGELVPQNPTDEPASVLLGRIRAERLSTPKPKRGRRKMT